MLQNQRNPNGQVDQASLRCQISSLGLLELWLLKAPILEDIQEAEPLETILYNEWSGSCKKVVLKYTNANLLYDQDLSILLL